MRHSFHPRLVNEPFSDPVLFIPFAFQRRAMLFDLGDVSLLAPRDLLKVSDVFVTHTHVDHFIGFDRLLRLSLGRGKTIRLFGPPQFFPRVEGKLAGYTWNLVQNYDQVLRLEVSEVHPERILTRTYLSCNAFRPQGGPTTTRPFGGIILQEDGFTVQGVHLDHGVPCLGLALVESLKVNIIKQGLQELDLPVGPWLTRFKQAVLSQADPGAEFTVTWEQRGTVIREKRFRLGELAARIARITPGRKVAYVTDASGTMANRLLIERLARGADLLFIEAAFLDRDRHVARDKAHLTAREAGALARVSRAGEIRVFHFSPRYKGRGHELQHEADAAFTGRESGPGKAEGLHQP